VKVFLHTALPVLITNVLHIMDLPIASGGTDRAFLYTFVATTSLLPVCLILFPILPQTRASMGIEKSGNWRKDAAGEGVS